VVTSAALLHYYMDGFIWKIREKETRQSLAVGGVDEVQHLADAPFGLFPAWARHAALWLLFAVPAGLLFVGESQGNVTSAIGIYENIVDAFPDSANAHYQLARELQDGGRFREARVQFERALELAPDLLQGHIFLGILLGDQRELAAAKVHFERALALDPRNAEVHNNLGIILDESGDPQTAKVHLERAIQIQPEYALAHNNLGTVLTKLGDHEQARIHHEHAVSLDPSFVEQNLP
jgi:tetratricopeptide (TPR) repeat protein